MQIGQFLLQHHMVVVGAADVSRAAGAGAAAVQRLMHGVQNRLVLAHAEVVVGAPDGDGDLPAFPVMGGAREAAGVTFEVGENPVVALASKAVQLVTEKSFVVHG